MLIHVEEKITDAPRIDALLSLPYELRQKSRLRAELDDGREVALMLPRGSVLRDGDQLRSEHGDVIQVRASSEPVSTVHCENTRDLARACYHLGNRHVPLQIGDGWVRFLCDHVLEDMVTRLGLKVVSEQAPFEPEAGAYHRHAH
jgi:urease accessory protein